MHCTQAAFALFKATVWLQHAYSVQVCKYWASNFVRSLPSVYLCSVYICYQWLVTTQIAFSIHMRNGLVQWCSQDTVDARAHYEYTMFVRTPI